MSVATPLNGANRFAHIDAMRAFAVMLVVVAHAGLGHIVPGGSGVTIFFSISGFIITYLLLRERDKTGGFSAPGFYLRRAIKIAPPLVLTVVIPTLIYSIWNSIDWGAFLAEVFFMFNWVYLGGEAEVLKGTGVVWSLSIEEQFYIAFALIWIFAVKSRHWRTIVVVTASIGVVASTLIRLVMATDPSLTHRIYYGSDTRLDGIAWGVLAAVAFHLWQERGTRDNVASRIVASDWALIAAVVVYLASLVVRDEWFRDTFRYTLQSLAACTVILYGLVPGHGPVRRAFYAVSQWRLVALIGLSSYSIYLVHLIIINGFRDRIALPAMVETALFTVVGVLAGIVMYKLVEIPAHRFGQHLRRRRRPMSAEKRRGRRRKIMVGSSVVLCLLAVYGANLYLMVKEPTQQAADIGIEDRADAYSKKIHGELDAAVKADYDAKTVAVPFPTGRPLNYLLAGDSLANGSAATTPDKSFRELVRAALATRGPVTSALAGKPGQGVDLIAPQALAAGSNFDVIVVEVGTNDVRRITPQAFAVAYDRMLASLRLQSPKAALVCLGPWRDTKVGGEYASAIERTCPVYSGRYRSLTQHYTQAVNRWTTGVMSNGLPAEDNFHPSDTGHFEIASEVANALRLEMPQV